MPLLQKIIEVIVMPVIGLMFAIALVAFLWGAFEFLKGSGNEQSAKGAREKMMWGIIGLFIMAVATGIVNLICKTVQCS